MPTWPLASRISSFPRPSSSMRRASSGFGPKIFVRSSTWIIFVTNAFTVLARLREHPSHEPRRRGRTGREPLGLGSHGPHGSSEDRGAGTRCHEALGGRDDRTG
jgi:hypothetical protein